MNTFASYRLHITPLSPVHIGTGESYEPTNYVIDDGVLHEFDTGAAMAAFSAEDRKDLLVIANRKPDENMIKKLQSFFYERRNILKAWAVNAIPVLPGVAQLYATRVGQTANREADGKQVLNRLEIDRTGYNPITRKPVLFGSSLKGAIRTALLDKVNNKRPLSDRDADLFNLEGLPDFEQRKRRREQRKVFPRLNQQLLKFQAGKFELDPLRLVQLSDAQWCEYEPLPAAQVFLAVNRKKDTVRDKHGNVRRSQAESGDLYQILESVPNWRYRAFSAQINLQQIDARHDDPVRRKVPSGDLCFSMDAIAKLCSNFYIPILKAEMQQMKKRGFLDSSWEKQIQQLLTGATDKLVQGKVFLLRVGRHSGAESVTLNGARRIKIMKGTPEYQPQAKTLWLAADTKDQQTHLLPFGWVLVEVQPLEAPEREWPELQALCEPHLKAARQFAAKRRAQAEAMAKARAEAEAKRREEEEKKRRKAEEEARLAQEKAERQARLAALSPDMQAVEAFRTFYLEQKAKGRYQPGGLFDEKRRTIVTSALQWKDSGARRALSTLLRRTVKEWTDWPNKKERKAELRGWLEQLENSED
jgi:CRISPR-associated protein Csm5